MNQCLSADVEIKHYSLTWCFSPGRWVLLRSSKDAGCHFVPPHGLFLGLVKAQGEVGATTRRTQHSVERGSFTPCASPQLHSQLITSTLQVSSCQNSILALYLHCSSVALTKIKCSRTLIVPLFHPVSHQGLLPPDWAKGKIKITMWACQILPFLRVPWEGTLKN